MKVAILTTDGREHWRQHDLDKPWFSTPITALLKRFGEAEQSSGLEIHVVSCTRRRMRSPEKLAPNIFFHSLYVPKLGWMRTLYYGCVRAVRKKLKEIRPEIVHGQGTEMDCAMEAVFSGLPNVVTIHGNMAEYARLLGARVGSFNWLAARLENFALRRTDGVFCNSEHTESLVKPRASRTWRVPNALRPEVLDRPVPGGAKTGPVLLNVGVVCENKQQLALLDLAEKLHKRHARCAMHFIGAAHPQGRYSGTFLDRIREAQQQGFACYSSPMPVSELIAAFDASAALVHTPQSEAFGLVVAEALARNLKFFGFNAGGPKDIAQGAAGAVLVAPGDWSALEREISAWLAQGCPPAPPNHDLMTSRYHPLVVARRHLEIYREVLSTRR
jgi:glycosyltransferase involved in cell wall biosynthesis